MYCHICGTKNSSGEDHCQKCGTRLKQDSSTEEQIWSEPSGLEPRNASATGTVSKRKSSPFLWIIPLLLAAIMGSLLTYYYNQENLINAHVKTLHIEAEKAALDGKYSEALELLDKALAQRPNVGALVQDRRITEQANNLLKQMDEAANLLKTGKLSEADKTIQTAAKTLNERQEPVFDKVRSALNNRKVTLDVLKVKKEIDQLTTVEALADKLKTISKLNGKEAEVVKKQITDKLAGISYKQAEQQVKKRDFTAALQTVDNGLSYAPEDQKLTKYRDEVLREKKAFEQAEEERIRLAEQQAAEEELRNRTGAVYVTDLSAKLDEYGDLYISGSVFNQGTRPISSVALIVSINASNGDYIGETDVYVYPAILDVGEEGYFETYYYGVYEAANVTVTNASWYVE
ncbi:hypothetical protein Q9R46_22335 [Paenibacillus sp. RRE4]|uniref:hypothetical protein n=1 Tax=Paenibacillus sp. RRE4 TaxID=2962587 RepID=UPI0028812896|nr:hypothetical protein [Paenibacillus sp. RRE4]MDT0125423.1 hypothetical protein [Paenibacillus sp. RRE4]